MKNLMLSTAILAGLTGFAAAQDASGAMFRTKADPMELRASQFIGMRVYSSETALDANEYAGTQKNWDDIGEINDVILGRDGAVQAVLVDIGGFLGMGERQVAVDMTAIKFVSDGSTGDRPDDFFLVMNAARTDFEAAPEYSMSPGMGTAATDAATADATATVPADGMAADATADATTTTTEAPADQMAATNDTTAMRQPVQRDGFSMADGEYLTTEKLTGAKVYDTNDEWIGDVGALIMTADGKITDAVIDVGGFLGMGEKPVALKLSDIDILRNETGNDVRVYVSMTKDQLKELPRFDG